MAKRILKVTGAALLAASASSLAAAPASSPAGASPQAEVGFVEIEPGLSLRRMVLRNPKAKGTVLLLHGFPETLFAWEQVSLGLAGEFEVHAFDWPGFGQSSRPGIGTFSYAPRDYAAVLAKYIETAAIDQSRLTIYATDIAGLPALLAAIDRPDLASTIIVGDFAPFDRPNFMHERLQRLKAGPASDEARVQLNANRDETLANAFTRGLAADARFDLSARFKADMASGWGQGQLTSADAFYHYYSHFTRDQEFLEANLHRLTTPLKVVWGAEDIYIDKQMGIEFARKAKAPLTLLAGVGHYAHLQSPGDVVAEIRATLP